MESNNIDWSKYTFRCSSLGHIMSAPKGKSNLQKYNDAVTAKDDKFEQLEKMKDHTTITANKLIAAIDKLDLVIDHYEPIKNKPHLSQGCKTHLADIRTVVKYARTRDIKNKYMEKGLLLEEDAITQYSLLTGIYHKKNKERRYNSWIEGELDLIDNRIVTDTKVNWDIFTFGRVIALPIDDDYHWQLDGYTDLWPDSDIGRLAYCLLNTPEHLIKREEMKLMYELFGNQAFYNEASDVDKKMYEEACVELRRNHIYDDIPIQEKVRIFEIKRDEDRIERIHRRVEECREYLTNLDLKHYEEPEEVEEAA